MHLIISSHCLASTSQVTFACKRHCLLLTSQSISTCKCHCLVWIPQVIFNCKYYCGGSIALVNFTCRCFFLGFNTTSIFYVIFTCRCYGLVFTSRVISTCECNCLVLTSPVISTYIFYNHIFQVSQKFFLGTQHSNNDFERKSLNMAKFLSSYVSYIIFRWNFTFCWLISA